VITEKVETEGSRRTSGEGRKSGVADRVGVEAGVFTEKPGVDSF